MLTQVNYTTIRITEQWGALRLQLYRPEANNSINAVLLEEMIHVLKLAGSDPAVKVVVLEGLPAFFCTGMDFKAAAEQGSDALLDDNPKAYYEVLEYFSICSKVIISKVEGKVNAGGIGFVAASDIVIAGGNATFGLSEALFGLLPACVMPFLIRRIGYQKALWMTLMTQGIPADRAFGIGLVDEISANVNEVLRKTLLRLTRLDTETIRQLKEYMSALWIIQDATKELAVNTITGLLRSEKIQNNIWNYIQNGKFPWDK